MLNKPEIVTADTETDAAFVVELAPVAVSAPKQDAELPPGPPQIDAAQSVPTPPATTSTPTPEERQLPDLPTVAAAEMEIPPPVPEQRPDPEPKEDPTPQPKPAESTPQAESLPSLAAAPPSRPDTPVGATSAAPVRGLSDRDRLAVQRWHTALAAHLNLFKRYPQARSEPPRDAVVVQFRIDGTGRIEHVDLVRSSGDDRFDDAAIDMVRRSSPVPKPPAQMRPSDLFFVIPVRFERR